MECPMHLDFLLTSDFGGQAHDLALGGALSGSLREQIPWNWMCWGCWKQHVCTEVAGIT